MKYSKKQYNYYSDDERMSYIREYLSSPESKSEFCKRNGFCAKLLTYWLNKYQIEDKDIGLLLMRVYVTRRAKNSSILLNPRIISRYEKTPMPSNRHLVTEALTPTQTWLYKVPL